MEEFFDKFRDLVHNFANSNPNIGTIVKGETIEIDDSHSIDVELRIIKYNNE